MLEKSLSLLLIYAQKGLYYLCPRALSSFQNLRLFLIPSKKGRQHLGNLKNQNRIRSISNAVLCGAYGTRTHDLRRDRAAF